VTVLPLETVIKKLTAGKQIFGIEENSIEVGVKSQSKPFQSENSIFSKTAIDSKSKNSLSRNEVDRKSIRNSK
jgi:dihydroorotase